MEFDARAARQYPIESFSLAERDRRWTAVRSLMDSAGIDILLVPTEADSRYLTQMADDIGPTIITSAGEVTALTARGRVGSAAARWVTDIRSCNRRWIGGIIDRLQEINADRKIIGVVGLDGSAREPDGQFNYQTLVVLREVFSHARWVGATGLMQEARYVKSDEEIAVLGRAAAGSDAGLQAAVSHLQPGVSDRELWGQMVLAMLRADTDRPRLTRLALFPPDEVQELPNQPIGRSAQPGQVLFAEAGGLVLGYSARGMQPAALGSLAQEWRDAWRVWTDAWNETWEALRPGASLAEVRGAAQRASTARFQARPLVEGEGLGDDMPLVTTGSVAFDRIQDRPLEPGVVVLVKPRVEWGGEGGHKEISWGDTVAIMADGPRRLGARPMEIIIRD